MKKVFLLGILILLPFKILFSQVYKLGFESGIGGYSMSDLKDLNTVMSAGLPFKSKIIADFPAYMYYEPKVIMKLGRAGVGLICSFQSTGSRVSSKDYSAEYRYDIIVKTNSPGIYFEYNLLPAGKNEIPVSISIKRDFTHLKIHEYLDVLDSVLINGNSKFNSRCWSLEPSIHYNHSFGFWSAGLTAGYCFNYGMEDFSKDYEIDFMLRNPSTYTYVKPDWSGIRVGLSVYINLNMKKEQVQ